MHVVVIGGGIGGLCLAHGLKKAGVSVAVYERDLPPAPGGESYSIQINPHGNRALYDCLPSDLWAAYTAATGAPLTGLRFVTERLSPLAGVDWPAAADPARGDCRVSRAKLLQILRTGLEAELHFGKTFERFAGADGQVVASFADGSTAVGDVLVGADGVGSRVRKQLLPQLRVHNLDIVGIGGKCTQSLPPALVERMHIVLPPAGCGMFVTSFIRTPIRQSAGASLPSVSAASGASLPSVSAASGAPLPSDSAPPGASPPGDSSPARASLPSDAPPAGAWLPSDSVLAGASLPGDSSPDAASPPSDSPPARASLPSDSPLLARDLEDHVFWALIARTANLGLADFRHAGGERVRSVALNLVRTWHPTLQRMVAETDPRIVVAIPLQSGDPPVPWETSRVTLLGDAIHTMTPLQGLGGNTALRDAQLLCSQLVQVSREQARLMPALHSYESAMRSYGAKATRASLQQTHTFVSDNRVARESFKIVLRVANALPPLKQILFRPPAA